MLIIDTRLTRMLLELHNDLKGRFDGGGRKIRPRGGLFDFRKGLEVGILSFFDIVGNLLSIRLASCPPYI